MNLSRSSSLSPHWHKVAVQCPCRALLFLHFCENFKKLNEIKSNSEGCFNILFFLAKFPQATEATQTTQEAFCRARRQHDWPNWKDIFRVLSFLGYTTHCCCATFDRILHALTVFLASAFAHMYLCMQRSSQRELSYSNFCFTPKIFSSFPALFTFLSFQQIISAEMLNFSIFNEAHGVQYS